MSKMSEQIKHGGAFFFFFFYSKAAVCYLTRCGCRQRASRCLWGSSETAEVISALGGFAVMGRLENHSPFPATLSRILMKCLWDAESVLLGFRHTLRRVVLFRYFVWMFWTVDINLIFVIPKNINYHLRSALLNFTVVHGGGCWLMSLDSISKAWATVALC